MKLRYGFNEIYGWWHMSQGAHHAQVQRRLKLMGTKVVRLFVFDQPVPSPFKDWQSFERLVQAVLDIGAKPMITFAKFPAPYDNPKSIRNFVDRSSEVLWSCLERWGGDEVSQWYWCIWNEPNNLIVGGDLAIDEYLRIYEALSSEIVRQLQPFLGSRHALIGGPAIDGTHRPYWMDWIARLLDEIDERQIGFVSWHCYGDWRPAVPSNSLGLEMYNSPDSPNGRLFESLVLARTPVYETRARGIARLLKNTNILNVCGELNTMSHHEHYYTLGLNQNLLGAAYYISALIHLIRGGADMELRWTATAHSDAYGLMSMEGVPSPAALAKQLFAQHIRYGDALHFPANRPDYPQIDCIVARPDDGRTSAVFVNTSRETVRLAPEEWHATLSGCRECFTLDGASADRVVRSRYSGALTLNGYGVGVITTGDTETIID